MEGETDMASGGMYAKLVGMLPMKTNGWKCWNLKNYTFQQKAHLFNLHFGVQNVSLWVCISSLLHPQKINLDTKNDGFGTCISFETWLCSVLLVC